VAAFTVAASRRVYDQAAGQWKDGDTLFLRCSAWRELADHVAESLSKGTRVIVTGRLKQRRYETTQGDKRTVYELDVDDPDPSLRWATAKIAKTSRGKMPHPGTGDPRRAPRSRTRGRPAPAPPARQLLAVSKGLVPPRRSRSQQRAPVQVTGPAGPGQAGDFRSCRHGRGLARSRQG
jgi:single-strand DNA-binding protein